MASALPLLQTVGDTLDGLGIATCVFDEADNTLLWNRSFLKFFPEQAGYIHAGEPYAANLRRFYQVRLPPEELPAIDDYITRGIARHRAQQRSYSFVHRGVRLWVSSLPLAGVGRIRIWRAHDLNTGGLGTSILGAADAPSIDGAGLFDKLPDGIMVTGADQRIEWVNEPFVLLYRLSGRHVAVGLRLENLYRNLWKGHEAQDGALFQQGLLTLVEGTRYQGIPFEVPLPDGRWSRVVAQRSLDGKGFFAHMDITLLKRQQQQLLDAERRARDSEAILQEKSALLEATLECMLQGVMRISAERVVVVCNRRAQELLGLPKELMDSRPTLDAVFAYQAAHGEFVHVPPELVEIVRNGGDFSRPYSYDRKRPDGRVIEVNSVPIQGGGVLRTFTDITERKRADERIRHVARHDGLTSLVNRDAFLEALNQAVKLFGASSNGFAVHFIDIDRFKPINDNYGHAVGDKVLALLAQRMRQIVRDGDLVARMGGDEFAVLQYRVEGLESAMGLANRILVGVAEDMEIESQQLQVGASIGIALYPTAGADADELLRSADAAMYAAKVSGRDCVRVFGVDGEPASTY
ncbi:MAG: diguanylate cyclase [Burkholderiales bacterium]|nr:diguanylate cyclase [Burkholderiales bacterium]